MNLCEKNSRTLASSSVANSANPVQGVTSLKSLNYQQVSQMRKLGSKLSFQPAAIDTSSIQEDSLLIRSPEYKPAQSRPAKINFVNKNSLAQAIKP